MLRLARIVILFLVTFHSAWGASTGLVIDSPRGGEVYLPGQQQTVVLGSKTLPKSLLVELSRDGGATFVTLGILDNSRPRRGAPPSLHWTVTAPAATNAVIRVTSKDLKRPGTATSNGFSMGGVSALDSGTASSGFVLTADGAGGAGFQPPALASGVSSTAGASIVSALNNAATTAKINGAVLADLPKAHISNSTLLSIPNGIDTAVSFDSVEFDSDNCHDFVASPTRLTCKTPGVYLMAGYAAFGTSSVGFRHGYLLVNGGTPTANAIASDVRAAVNTSDFTVSTLVSLKAGDFIEFVVAQNSGAALNVNVRGFMMAKLP